MKVGISATREGLSFEQKEWLIKGLVRGIIQIDWLGHGDCIGGDADVHEIVKKYTKARIEIFPPENPSKRAWCEGDIVHTPKPYLDRNLDIINWCDVFLGFPKGTEEVRSGTWSTIRKAKNKPGLIIYPNAEVVQLWGVSEKIK